VVCMGESAFVFGATGYVGRQVVKVLQSDGFEVAALARRPDSGAEIAAMSARPVAGSIEDLEPYASELRRADAIVVAAKPAYEREEPLIADLERVLAAGSGTSQKTLIFTSGTGVLGVHAPEGQWDQRSFAEDDEFTPPPWLALRVRTERRVRALAARGVRAMVIRPPLIWGLGGSLQVPAVFQSVRATGHACYVGSGLNVYSNVHVLDLAQLYGLAVRRGTAGALYHAVAGELDFRGIAEAVATVTGTTTRSLTADEATEVWGPVVARTGFSTNSRSRAVISRAELGWSPSYLDLRSDILTGSYRETYVGGGL
jgi:nucleoside-diphosphate-sugar epimerase